MTFCDKTSLSYEAEALLKFTKLYLDLVIPITSVKKDRIAIRLSWICHIAHQHQMISSSLPRVPCTVIYFYIHVLLSFPLWHVLLQLVVLLSLYNSTEAR